IPLLIPRPLEELTFALIGLTPFIVTAISLKYSYSKLTNTSTLKEIRLKIRIKLFRLLPSSKETQKNKLLYLSNTI
ncbi:hypothetical protein GT037_005541, partial [Alternaria burnsii]